MNRREIWAVLRRGLPVLMAVGAFGCAYQLVRSGSVNHAEVGKIETGLEQVRQLSFLKPVPLVVENRAEADRDIRAQVTHQISDREFRIDGETGALIGMYPEGIKLKQETLKLLDSQVAGFYDPDTKRMILVSGVSQGGIWDSGAQMLMQRDVMG